MKKTLIATAAILALTAGAGAASAHDDDYYWGYFQHRLDHAEHERFHQQFNAAHEAAHEEGFDSPEEHEAWHRAYEATHEEFHEDHPNTRHDHYDGYDRPYYRSYGPAYGYYGRSNGVTWWFSGDW